MVSRGSTLGGLTLLFFVFGCTSYSSSAADLSFIRASSELGDPHFYDDAGRTRIFHGGNRVMKASPWFFEDMANSDAEFALLKKMGVNVIRLGYMWSGLMPTNATFFNQTYVDVIKGIVNRMSAHGIYALLDMHEDVLSSKFCLYDGAPRWVIDKSKPKHPFPWPLSSKKGNCSRGWMENTLSEAAATAYQDIYDNNHGMLDDLAAFWRYSAAQFKDVGAVIGYETMNEPFAGNFYADPTLLLPGNAGRKNLARLHEAAAGAIREHDDRHLVFYEPVTWGMLFDGKIVGSGFQQVPGGPAYRNRSVFSYHYYCATFVQNWRKHPTAQKLVCDHLTGPLVFQAVKKDLAHLGGAAMMTEGIACGDNHTECSTVMAMLDSHLFSWTSYADSQGALFDPAPSMQEAWARTYARAVAGTPTSMNFDPVTKDFQFCFTPDPTVAAPTEIFASMTYSYNTAGGRKVTVLSGNIHAEDDPTDPDIVLVRPSSDKKDGDSAPGACLRIQRK